MSTAILNPDTRTITLASVGVPGRPGIVWHDEGWQSGAYYVLDAGLYHHGSTWRATAAHSATPATEPGMGEDWPAVWTQIAQGTDPRLTEAVIEAATGAASALAGAEAARAAAQIACNEAGASASAAAASAQQAAQGAPIGLLISSLAPLPDGGWHICRDYPASANLDRLRMEVLAGKGDAGTWYLESGGAILAGPLSFQSDAPLILSGLGLELAPGSEVIAWHVGGTLAPPFAVLIQIDGRL